VFNKNIRDGLILGLFYFGIYILRQVVIDIKLDFQIIKLIVFIINEAVLSAIIFLIMFAISDAMFFYNKSKNVLIKKHMNSLIYLVIADIISIILINKNIEGKNIITIIPAYLLVVTLSVISSQECEKGKGKERDTTSRGDLPVINPEDLFPEREVELENIINYIDNNTPEGAVVISINGKWGEGKTSFMNCIRKKYEGENGPKNNIIWIQPMVVDSRESLVKYFFKRLSIILEENKIYTGKFSNLKQYWELILGIIGKEPSTLERLDIFKNKELEDYREYKAYLQNDINLLVLSNKIKKILVVIDDIDRVDDENKISVLKFIKEIADFEGLVIVFAMDYEKMIGDRINHEYLEKFIHKRFDLKQMNEYDVIRYFLRKEVYLKTIYDNDTLQDGIEELRKEFTNYFKEIHKDINDEIDEYNKKHEKPEAKDKIGNIDDAIIKNPRRIKRVFIEIEDMYNILNGRVQNNKNLDNKIFKNKFIELNINKAIVRFAYVKVFYEFEFSKIIGYGGLNRYLDINIKNKSKVKDVDNFIVKSIFKYTGYTPGYDIIKPDKDIIRFIDDYFINHYSKSYLTELYLDREAELIKMISDENIKEDESIKKSEYIKELVNIVLNRKDSDKESMITTVFDYIDNVINDGSFNIEGLIKTITKKQIMHSFLNENYLLTSNINKILKRHKIELENQNNKDVLLSYMEDINKTIIFKIANNIALLLIVAEYKSNEDIEEKYKKIKNENEVIGDLSELNEYMLTELNCKPNDSNLGEKERLDVWKETLIKKIQENKEISLSNKGFLLNELDILIKILKEIDIMGKKLSNNEVSIANRNCDYLKKMEADEIKNTLREIKESFDENKTNDENHDIIGYYFSVIEALYKGKNITVEKMLEMMDIADEIYYIIEEKDILVKEEKNKLIYWRLMQRKLKDKYINQVQ